MPSAGELRRPLVWPALAVALLLSGITGYVDAIAFDLFLGVFPANQSGNAVFLGVSIGGGGQATGWQSGASMLAFVLGIVIGELGRRRLPGPKRGAWLLVFEVVLLLLVVVIAGPIDGVDMVRGAESYLLIVLLSVAMGVQTTVIRHVAGTAVATTYVTGAMDRLGAAISRVLARESRLRHERAVLALVWIVMAYVGGAALGASAVGEWRWAVLLAAGAVGAIALAWLLAPQALEAATDPSTP